MVRDDEGSGVPLSVWPGNEIEAELVLALICIMVTCDPTAQPVPVTYNVPADAESVSKNLPLLAADIDALFATLAVVML